MNRRFCRLLAASAVMTLGLSLAGCQSGDHSAKGPVAGTPLASVPVYTRGPAPTGAVQHGSRVLPTPDGAHTYAISFVPQAQLHVTDATVRRSGPQWSVSIHVVADPALAAASMAGGRYVVLLDGKAVVPLLGVVEKGTKLTGYGMLFGSNKAAAVAAAHEWTTSVVVES